MLSEMGKASKASGARHDANTKGNTDGAALAQRSSECQPTEKRLQSDFECLMAYPQLAKILDEIGATEASALTMLDEEDLDALAQWVDTMLQAKTIRSKARRAARACTFLGGCLLRVCVDGGATIKKIPARVVHNSLMHISEVLTQPQFGVSSSPPVATPLSPSNDQTAESAPIVREIVIVLVCDGTGSMGDGLKTISNMMSEFLAVAEILGLKLRVCYYRDYDIDSLGGYKITPRGATYDEMKKFVKENIIPKGGGALPEAQKTMFEMLLGEDAPLHGEEQVIFHFTDAPPHPDDHNKLDIQGQLERAMFQERQWVHDNWKALCDRVKQSAHAVITFSKDKSYNTMGLNLGSTYPTTQEMMDMVCLMIGTETGVNPTPRLKQISNDESLRFKPAVEVSDIVRTIHKLKLVAIFENVIKDCPQALTTNNILGKAWRRLCTMRHDPEVQTQVEKLCNELSKVINTLPGPQAALLKQWVADSYDNENQFKELVSKAWVEGEKMIHIDAPIDDIDRQMLMDLLRECKFSAKVMKMFGLCKIGTIKGPSPLNGGTLQCLPLRLEHKDFFCAIPSLVVPGTMFSERGSFLNAILSQKFLLLKEISETYLENNIGWVDHSLNKNDPNKGNEPANFSKAFLDTLCTTPVEDRVRLLGEDTTAKLNTFSTLWGYRRNMETRVNYTRACEVPADWKEKATLDHKFLCSSCNKFRSKTNQVGHDPDICGLCYYVANNTDTGDFTIHTVMGYTEPEDTSLLTCCKSCKRDYAVTCVKDLNVSSKCHNCRFRQTETYSNNCGLCLRSFVSPTIQGVEDGYTCARCASGDVAVTQKETTVSDIMDSSPVLWGALGLEPEVGSEIKTMSMPKLISTPLGNINKETAVELNVNGVNIINWHEVSLLVVQALLNGDGRGVCTCCTNDVELDQLDSFCGNDDCTVKACGLCITEWYRQSKSGSIVYEAHLSCPYCKRRPTGRILRKYASHLQNLRCRVDTQWQIYNGYFVLWCNNCQELKKYALRGECGDTPAPNISGQSCRGCKDAAAAREAEAEAAAALQVVEYAEAREAAAEAAEVAAAIQGLEFAGEQFPDYHEYGYVSEDGGYSEPDDDDVPRPCPGGCGFHIVKNGGCDHIECHCGAHICWKCMQIFETSDDVYKHMTFCGRLMAH